eukprot:scaffold2947_cov352-Ochromonas_danica.AAC.1
MKGETPTLQEAQTKLKRLEEVLKSEAKKRKRNEEEDVSKAADGIAMRVTSSENNKRRRLSENSRLQGPSHQQSQRNKYGKTSEIPTRCQNCDLPGHIGRQCKRSKTKCHYCGKDGHMEKYCRLKRRKYEENGRYYDQDRNKHNRNHYQYDNSKRRDSEIDKKKEDRAFMISATSGWNGNKNDDVEDLHAFSFMSRSHHFAEENNNSSMQKSENVYIDTAATVHVIRDLSLIRSVNVDAQTDQGIQLSLQGIAGRPLRSTAVGSIPGLGRFAIVPEAEANLLSVQEANDEKKARFKWIFEDNKWKIYEKEKRDKPLMVVPHDGRN